MPDVLTYPMIIDETNRHGGALTIMNHILKDRHTIQQQRTVVQANHKAKLDRINVLGELLGQACANCGHARKDHAARGRCYGGGCDCFDWIVVDHE